MEKEINYNIMGDNKERRIFKIPVGDMSPEEAKELMKEFIKTIPIKMDVNEIKKELYKSKAMATFSHYISGNLYYNVPLGEAVYQFPISTTDDVN
ncbi:MAG TPA: hypothetical protein VLB82_06050, partial [Thermodesulfobacteriota bacterium]|nr:hypothetical protein [Thermodesulfobacteriota bacterium]